MGLMKKQTLNLCVCYTEMIFCVVALVVAGAFTKQALLQFHYCVILQVHKPLFALFRIIPQWWALEGVFAISSYVTASSCTFSKQQQDTSRRELRRKGHVFLCSWEVHHSALQFLSPCFRQPSHLVCSPLGLCLNIQHGVLRQTEKNGNVQL